MRLILTRGNDLAHFPFPVPVCVSTEFPWCLKNSKDMKYETFKTVVSLLLLKICMIVLCINEQRKGSEVFTVKETSHVLYLGIVGRFRAICDQQDL